MNRLAPTYGSVASVSVDERAEFIKRTYLTLFAAILAFVGASAGFLFTGISETLAGFMLGGRASWGIVLLLFMGASYAGESMAIKGASRGAQILGLGLVVGAWTMVFSPLVVVATILATEGMGDPFGILGPALGITGVLFTGLTGVVLLTRKNFSFLRSVVYFGSIASVILVFASLIFGFQLGIVFCWAMVALASVSILYKTSQVLHDYRTDQHIAAATTLFASFALLLWYVIRILMDRRN